MEHISINFSDIFRLPLIIINSVCQSGCFKNFVEIYPLRHTLLDDCLEQIETKINLVHIGITFVEPRLPTWVHEIWKW